MRTGATRPAAGQRLHRSGRPEGSGLLASTAHEDQGNRHDHEGEGTGDRGDEIHHAAVFDGSLLDDLGGCDGREGSGRDLDRVASGLGDPCSGGHQGVDRLEIGCCRAGERTVVEGVLSVLAHLTVIWLLFLVANRVADAVIRMREMGAYALDAQLVHLVSKLVAGLLALYALTSLAESLGVPIATMLAGLGVGGLAVALAVRPTLENVVGGFVLFADAPVKVGEFIGARVVSVGCTWSSREPSAPTPALTASSPSAALAPEAQGQRGRRSAAGASISTAPR